MDAARRGFSSFDAAFNAATVKRVSIDRQLA
ncbi:hypothetical protein X771_25280 [Mesorhizobium sp. LSJC277A00]|nr:hypothetical protein X771_25280 [Mesorhizobium sp. LSJC277A00]